MSDETRRGITVRKDGDVWYIRGADRRAFRSKPRQAKAFCTYLAKLIQGKKLSKKEVTEVV